MSKTRKNKKRDKRIIKILERDQYRCGIHSGGCGKKLNISKEKPTEDHIISKSFLHSQWKSFNYAPYLFRGLWNVQVMCDDCNKNKEGQFINFPIFKCKCHCVYINMNGDQFIYYKNRFRVEKIQYYGSSEKLVGKKEVF